MLSVETEFDLKIPERDMTPANFRSIARITELVQRAFVAAGYERLIEPFLQKLSQRGDGLLVGGKILGHPLVEIRGAVIKRARGGIVADKAGDFLHFGDPAISLRRHLWQLLPKLLQHLLLAEGQAPSSNASADPARIAASIIAAPIACVPLVMPA